jgi:hypothetical protein
MTIDHAHFPDPLHFREAGIRLGTLLICITHYFRYFNPKHPIVTVPTGFLSDGASVPRLFWPILGPFGDAFSQESYFAGAIIHDWLYNARAAKTGITRRQADAIFLSAMEDLRVPWLTRRTVWAAVRAFGWIHFRKPSSGAVTPLPA